MISVLDLLNSIPVTQWGHVVWLGVGDDALALRRAEALPAVRWVLVEGDAAVARRLRASTRLLGHVDVVEAAVAREAGPIDWRCFNLPMLNGPDEPSTALRSRFPRLQQVDQRTVQARASRDVLRELRPGSLPGRPNLLLVGSQDGTAGLLAGVPAELLEPFEWIICAGSDAPADLYSALHTVTPGPGLAPWSVWRLDRSKADLRLERDRLLQQFEATTGRQRELEDLLLRAEVKVELAREWLLGKSTT